MSREQDRLQFTISRFDQYYDGVNNKSNIVLALNTLLLGSILSGYPLIKEKIEITIAIQGMFWVLICLAVTVIVLNILTAIPFLNSSGSSLLFHNDIEAMGKKQFSKKSAEVSSANELKDYRNQVFYLAKGLKKKHQKLKISLWLLAVQFTLVLPYIALLLKQFKV